MILDHLGQPIDMAALRTPQTAGVAHLAHEFDRHPSRGLTPAKLATLLQTAERGDITAQVELADDIEERDGHVYAELGKRKGAVASLAWDVHAPEKPSADEQRMADEVRTWLRGLPEFADVVLGMMDAVLKGYAMHELVWEPDATLGAKRLAPRFTFQPQRMFTVSADRRALMLRSLRSTDAPAGSGLPPVLAEPLAPFAWLAHVHESRSGYLTRNGLVRVLCWPYLFKNFSVRDLAEFLEIFGLPVRLGRYPAGASDKEKATLLQAVVSIGHNAAGIIPAGMSIDFMEAAKGTEGPFVAMWDRMEAIESKVVLGQTLTAGEGRNGTQALGTVHNEVRMDIRNADARQVEKTLNAQLVRAYCLLNFAGADPRRLPRLAFDTSDAEDLTEYADSLPKLAASGLRIGVAWAHEKLRIPMATDTEPTLRGPAPAAVPGVPDPASNAGQVKPGDKPAGNAKKPLAALAANAGRQDAMDDLVDDALADWELMLQPIVDPLLAEIDKAVAAGESLASLRDRLPAMLALMDARPMAERLARAAFFARLCGAADLDLGNPPGQ